MLLQAVAVNYFWDPSLRIIKIGKSPQFSKIPMISVEIYQETMDLEPAIVPDNVDALEHTKSSGSSGSEDYQLLT